MRIARIVSIWVILTICIAGMLIGKTPAEIDVACPQPQGCFMVIQQAIDAAPEGATIKIGPGIYYEKPLTIEKSLTLVGAGRTQPVIGKFKTVIQAVDPGAALTIRYPEGRQSPMLVALKYLSISALLNEGKDKTNIGIEVVSVQDIEKEDFQLSLEDCAVGGYYGIEIHGPAKVSIQRSRIWVESQAIMGGEIELALLNSNIRGSGQTPRIAIADAEALFQGNYISGPYGGSEGWGIMVYRKARVTLLNNTIEFNAIGVYLAMSVTAEFRENRIINNSKYGIALLLPQCALHPPDPELLFRGQILGVDNEIHNNGQDLCPPDYPWPEGFVKEESG
jgi:parallel beta-helix repeat protein